MLFSKRIAFLKQLGRIARASTEEELRLRKKLQEESGTQPWTMGSDISDEAANRDGDVFIPGLSQCHLCGHDQAVHSPAGCKECSCSFSTAKDPALRRHCFFCARFKGSKLPVPCQIELLDPSTGERRTEEGEGYKGICKAGHFQGALVDFRAAIQSLNEARPYLREFANDCVDYEDQRDQSMRTCESCGATPAIWYNETASLICRGCRGAE